jgi:RNA polymerase sigma-70 factor (ECF subfamily)
MVTDTGDLGTALARARLGDEAAFLQLWRSLQPRLLRYLHLTGCADPDDVASETWLQVVRDLHQFSGSGADFRGWLFTVGRHRAIDAARSSARRPVIGAGAGLEEVADEQHVEDQVLDGISAQRAIAIVARLSKDQAEAVALRVIAGLDTAQVARILGKSAGSVRVSLHRGLKTLAADPAVRALATAAGAADQAGEPPGGRHRLAAGDPERTRSAGPGAPTAPRKRAIGEVDW